jgi:mono/diheme cytochrome c family protein
MRNSAVDNPAFIARTIGDWLNSWRTTRPEQLKSYAEVPRLTMTRGQYTFATHCAACHTIGRGDGIGPDLRGVTAVRDRAWLSRFIVEPDKMMAERDPIALALLEKYEQVRMPNLGLSREDAAAILGYVEEQSAAAPAPAARRAATPVSTVAGGGSSRLTPIVDRYLRIQRALHADALDGTVVDARAIAAEALALGAPGRSIQAAAEKFQRAPDIRGVRDAFGALSDAIIRYAEEGKAGLGDYVTAAYCPMAKKYWLQTGQKVQNPYYGQAMSECGRIVPALPHLGR